MIKPKGNPFGGGTDAPNVSASQGTGSFARAAAGPGGGGVSIDRGALAQEVDRVRAKAEAELGYGPQPSAIDPLLAEKAGLADALVEKLGGIEAVKQLLMGTAVPDLVKSAEVAVPTGSGDTEVTSAIADLTQALLEADPEDQEKIAQQLITAQPSSTIASEQGEESATEIPLEAKEEGATVMPGNREQELQAQLATINSRVGELNREIAKTSTAHTKGLKRRDRSKLLSTLRGEHSQLVAKRNKLEREITMLKKAQTPKDEKPEDTIVLPPDQTEVVDEAGEPVAEESEAPPAVDDLGIRIEEQESAKPVRIQLVDALSVMVADNLEIAPEELVDTLKRMVTSPEKAEHLLSTLEAAQEAGSEDESTSDEATPPPIVEGLEDAGLGSETPDILPETATEKEGDNLPAEMMLHERRKRATTGGYTARFAAKAPRSDSTWELLRDGQPCLKVSAAQAFGGVLFSAPPAGEYPKPFGSYYDVFVDDLYGKSLVHFAQADGLARTAQRTMGTLLKTAQPVSGILPDQDTRQPMSNTGSGEEMGWQEPENEGKPEEDGTFNPSPEAEEEMGAEEPEKMLISDMLIDYLSPQVANGTYSVEEILNELRATFEDDDATREFEGALQERSDSLSDEIGAEEEGAGVVPTLDSAEASPEAGNAAEEIIDETPPPGESTEEKPEDAKTEGEEKSEEFSRRRAPKKASVGETPKASANEVHWRKQALHLAEERTMSFKAKLATDFVHDILQKRGAAGNPVVPTAESLVATGTSLDEATTQAAKAVEVKVKELIQLDDNAFYEYRKLAMALPVIEPASDIDKDSLREEGEVELRKKASAQPLIFMEREELHGLDLLLPSNVGESRYTQVAAEHNAQRKNRPRI